MPMESVAQRHYLWANHPDIAKEFEAATPKGAKLPEHVGSKAKKPRPEMDKPKLSTAISKGPSY